MLFLLLLWVMMYCFDVTNTFTVNKLFISSIVLQNHNIAHNVWKVSNIPKIGTINIFA